MTYFYTHRKLFIKSESLSDKPIKIWYRNSTIQENFIGKNYLIHNGKNFVLIKIIPEMVGHKFGEFIPTKKLCIYKKSSKKKKK